MPSQSIIVVHPGRSLCDGCKAKAMNKSHHKDTLLRKQNKKNIVTMDQLTVAELNQPMGIGGFKYGIVFQKVDTDYWWLAPLRTLKFTESFYHFVLFCDAIGADKGNTMVYCDQHPTLRAMCK